MGLDDSSGASAKLIPLRPLLFLIFRIETKTKRRQLTSVMEDAAPQVGYFVLLFLLIPLLRGMLRYRTVHKSAMGFSARPDVPHCERVSQQEPAMATPRAPAWTLRNSPTPSI